MKKPALQDAALAALWLAADRAAAKLEKLWGALNAELSHD